MEATKPIIVIVGPTASGKTALAIEIARRHGGEVICADSRTVFRGMDIGTAKPTLAERDGVPHWGLDLTEPGERFTAAAFKQYTLQKIKEIRARGKIPVIAGGTGLYVDGVIFDYRYPSEPSDEDRARFESMSTEELYRYCIDTGIELPLNDKNRRHLLHAAYGLDTTVDRRTSVSDEYKVFGVAVPKQTLLNRIEVRSEHMFEDGVVDEAKRLGEKYGWDSEAMTGNIYPLVRRYLGGEVTEADVISTFQARDWQLAKRQMTWFRRNPFIAWGSVQDILSRVDQLFTSEQ